MPSSQESYNRGVEDFQETLRRAKAGDRGAIDALMHAQLPGLRAFIRLKSGRVLRERESCSDLVQTICRSVLESIDRVECSDESSFRNWLFTVAERRIINRFEYHSAAKRDPRLEVPLDGKSSRSNDFAGLLGAYDALGTPSRHAAAREEVERIETAIDALPTEYREVLIRACIQKQAHEAIANELGRSRESTRKILSRARAKLAILLREKNRGS